LDRLQQLDEAWELFEEQVELGVLKKDIAPILNEQGFTTLKGKPWTYQTLMLEQRKRKGSLKPRHPKINNLEISNLNKSAPETPCYKMGEELRRMPAHKSIQFLMDEEGFSEHEVADILNEHGKLDYKGRSWNPQSVLYELGNRWMDRSDEALEFSGSLGEFIDRSVKREEREQEASDRKRGPDMEQAWSTIKDQLQKGIKKKKVMHNLNMGGFLTRTGKPWTYQTLLLEIKRMEMSGYFGQPEDRVAPTPAPKITTRIQADDSIEIILAKARKLIQKKVIDNLNEKGSRTRSGKPWTYGVLLLELLKMDLNPEEQVIMNSPEVGDSGVAQGSEVPEQSEGKQGGGTDLSSVLFGDLN
jgi:hypothetical protein